MNPISPSLSDPPRPPPLRANVVKRKRGEEEEEGRRAAKRARNTGWSSGDSFERSFAEES